MASITQRVTKTGTSWRIQIRRQGEQPIHRTAETKGEAQEIARKLERNLDEGKPVVARTMTVARLIDRYLEDLGTTLETMKRDRVLSRSKETSLTHIRRLLGPVEIRDLDNRKIVQFAQDRRDTGQGRNRRGCLTCRNASTPRGPTTRRCRSSPTMGSTRFRRSLR